MRQQCLGPLRSLRVWGASAQSQPPPWRPGYPDPPLHSRPGVTPLTRSLRVEAPDDTHATSKETPKSPRPRRPHRRLLSPHTPPRSALASPALLLSRRRAMSGLASSPLPLPCPVPGALSVPRASYPVARPLPPLWDSLLAPPARPNPTSSKAPSVTGAQTLGSGWTLSTAVLWGQGSS